MLAVTAERLNVRSYVRSAKMEPTVNAPGIENRTTFLPFHWSVLSVLAAQWYLAALSLPNWEEAAHECHKRSFHTKSSQFLIKRHKCQLDGTYLILKCWCIFDPAK